MKMLARRDVMIAGAAFALAAPYARATSVSRFLFIGSMAQGSLVIGNTEAGAKVSVDGASVLVSPQGQFAFGFAFDQKTRSRVTAVFADGSTESQDVTPIAREYETQVVTGLPPETVTPTPEEAARIEREHATVAEARKRDSNYDWFSEKFDWPAKGIISGLFGSQRILNGVRTAPHFGVDIAAAEGAPVHAPANATVLIAEEFFLEGNYTLLDHGHGVFTGYLHQSKLLVKAGETVKRGQQIGMVGKTGRATGPHLHWALNWFQVRLDPSLSASSPAPTKA